MGHVAWQMFSWPAGIVVGNLIASAIWAAPALWRLHRKLDRLHAERIALAVRQHAAVLAAVRGESSREAPR